jgi:hypothetical protein
MQALVMEGVSCQHRDKTGADFLRFSQVRVVTPARSFTGWPQAGDAHDRRPSSVFDGWGVDFRALGRMSRSAPERYPPAHPFQRTGELDAAPGCRLLAWSGAEANPDSRFDR